MSVFHVAVTILFVFDFIPFGMFQAVAAPEKCTKQGSFEIVDGTCQNYYMCIFNGVELVSYELKCAPPTVFSPVTGYCTPSTQYPCTQSTTPSTSTVPTSSTPASDSSSSGTTASVSSSSGTTAPVTSSSGTTASVSSSSGTTAPVSSSSGTTAPVTSSSGTTASVSSSSGTTASVSSSAATTASVSSSTVSSTSTAATTTTKPTCLTTGRYPIPGSGCKMYYYCYVDGPNIINYTNLTCPTILVFNPTVQKCVLPTTYPCPS